MKTLLTSIQTTLRANVGAGNTLSYVLSNNIRVVAPRGLPPLRVGQLPFIGIAPMNSPERWKTNAQREASHIVEIYCVLHYPSEEAAIIGSGTQKGITDMLDDVTGLLRNQRFSSHLATPFELTEVSYALTGEGDLLHLIVAVLRFEGKRIFSSTLP